MQSPNGGEREWRGEVHERRGTERAGEDPDAEEAERDMPRRQRDAGESPDHRRASLAPEEEVRPHHPHQRLPRWLRQSVRRRAPETAAPIHQVL